MITKSDKSRTHFDVTHVRFETPVPFDRFIANMEKQLGNFETKQVGSSGFMQFTMLDHGDLLTQHGRPTKARQYLIGNPDLALKMTLNDIRAALYAPIRCLVYVRNAYTTVEYDLPSSIFGQFNNPQVDVVARELDLKLSQLFQKAESREA